MFLTISRGRSFALHLVVTPYLKQHPPDSVNKHACLEFIMNVVTSINQFSIILFGSVRCVMVCLYCPKSKPVSLQRFLDNKKATDFSAAFSYCEATSYSHRGKPPTTIGAKELNFRVRYGNGCDLFAIITSLLREVCSFKTG